ncbi:MAG: diacylglycerol kinase family protein [Lachnospiraceae bacterium]|nr:diacylglycerol kinase family protein [Lachnospiraceae bacterium]
MKYILYNPKANNGEKPEYLEGAEYKEVIGLDYQAFFDGLNEEDEVVLVGGDGTLNYFINAVDTDNIKNNVYLKKSGSGNDFLNDLDIHYDREVLLNDVIKNLPTVYVNGMEKKFINGIGYGIDGYCCEKADEMKASGYTGKIDYTGIAIKGLLFHFKKKKADVRVDGKEYHYDQVWLAPSMKGKYYGGGMCIAPAQDRKSGKLSFVVYHCRSKLKALIVFPNIFKGTHIEHKEMVEIHEGKEIEVTFNEPCALQIDGETVLNVTTYKVKV